MRNVCERTSVRELPPIMTVFPLLANAMAFETDESVLNEKLVQELYQDLQVIVLRMVVVGYLAESNPNAPSGYRIISKTYLSRCQHGMTKSRSFTSTLSSKYSLWEGFQNLGRRIWKADAEGKEDKILQHGRAYGRDHSRDHGRDHSRDHGRDHSRDHGRDHSRDHGRDHSRDHGRDHSSGYIRGPGRSHSRAPGRETIENKHQFTNHQPVFKQLFDQTLTPVINQFPRRCRIPDQHWQRAVSIIQGVLHTDRWQSGNSIFGRLYEEFLRHQLKYQEKFRITADFEGKKQIGAFYTPQYLVKAMVDRTIGLEIKEHVDQFLKTLESSENNKFLKNEQSLASHPTRANRVNRKTQELATFISTIDPIEYILHLTICDPAVGCGYFLIETFRCLYAQITKFLAHPLVKRNRYQFSLIQRFEKYQASIDHHNSYTLEQFIEREIVTRCLYGIDQDRLAVEVAKLNLWVQSELDPCEIFPLHQHLRYGNALLGLDFSRFLSNDHPRSEGYATLIKRLRDARDLELLSPTSPLRQKLTQWRRWANLVVWNRIYGHHLSPPWKAQLANELNVFRTTGEFTSEIASLCDHLHTVAPSLPFFHIGLEFFDLNRQQNVSDLPKSALKFDYILTNPPFGATITDKALIGYWKRHYRAHKDTAAFFIHFILQNTTHYGIIVPKSIAFYASWAKTRQKLLRQSRITHVIDTGLTFPNVNFETVVLLGTTASVSISDNKLDNFAQKSPISISRAEPLRTIAESKKIITEASVPSTFFKRHHVIIFRGITPGQQAVLERMEANSLPLGTLVGSAERIYRGVYVPLARKQEIVSHPQFHLPAQLPINENENKMIWIDKVPHIGTYRVRKYHWIQFDPHRDQSLIRRAQKTRVPRVFLKVLRGNRLVAFPDPKGQFCTTAKLVNVRLPRKGEFGHYSYNFLCGIFNSPYPAFYLQYMLYSQTTETSRVLDYPYARLIPIPSIRFNASCDQIQDARDHLTQLLEKSLSAEQVIVQFDQYLQLCDPDIHSHLLHDSIAYLVDKLISLKQISQRKAENLFNALILEVNASELASNSDTSSKIIKQKAKFLRLVRKNTPISAGTIMKKLPTFYSFSNQVEIRLQSIVTKHIPQIQPLQDKAVRYHTVVDHLARLSYGLTQDDATIIHTALAKT